MKRRLSVLLVALFMSGLGQHGRAAAAEVAGPLTPPVVYTGMCEASGAVGFADAPNLFLVVNDEDNLLRTYSLEAGAPRAAAEVGDMNVELELDRNDPDAKADFEATAWLGERLYVIASHSRSKKGNLRPSRFQLLEFRPTFQDGNLILGKPRFLAGGLAKALAGLDKRLDAALLPDKLEKLKMLAPEKKGLNIEGLAGGPDGTLLIGLRNPLSNNEALLVRFWNVTAVMDTSTTLPQLTIETIKGLGKRGIRGLEYDPTSQRYFIMAGAAPAGSNFKLFTWSGKVGEAAVAVKGSAEAIAAMPEFAPEAMFLPPGSSDIVLLSDDGDRASCKTDNAFRSSILKLKP